MNKKEYMKPAMRVVKIQHTGMLMTSGLRSVSTDEDIDIDYGGGGDGTGIWAPR